jgi:hypothetical protein
MAQAANGKTVTQRLAELVEWFILDKSVELKFVPEPERKGRLSPEFKFEYWMDGRRITERCLAMCIMTALQEKDYNFNLAKIIAALTYLSWQNYVATQPYPEWLKKPEEVKVRRPVGRPRIHPKIVKVDEFVDAPAAEAA